MVSVLYCIVLHSDRPAKRLPRKICGNGPQGSISLPEDQRQEAACPVRDDIFPTGMENDIMKKICVIGSLNIDLTVTIPRFHLPGETIFGTDFKTYTGGKGGNQAVAAAKLGADVRMAGCLGNDSNAEIYRARMKELHIKDLVRTVPGIPSGTALIEVSPDGENRIVVVPGANMKADRAMVDEYREQISECDIFLLQLEIPTETVSYIAETFSGPGKTIILDPAPAVRLPDKLYKHIDFITPNETELSILSGCSTDSEEEISAGAALLTEKGCRNVIVKIGARGAMLVNSGRAEHFPGFKVDTVDTTAAGDTFNAAFAVALAAGKTVPGAITFANAAAAISTMGPGAQGAMPSLSQVEQLLGTE